MASQHRGFIRYSVISIFFMICIVQYSTSFAVEVTPVSKPFTFRNGITWDSTPEQMMMCENIDAMEPDDWAGFDFYKIYEVQVSKYKADLGYIYNSQQLIMAWYNFIYDNLSHFDIEYLESALCLRYGKITENDPNHLQEILLTLQPSYGGDVKDITYYSGWELSDGTLIVLYTDIQDSCLILYINENRVNDFVCTAIDSTAL